MQLSDLSTQYVRTDEAALFLGLSPRTLEKHRTFGTGPVYRKLGARVVYAREDLMAWADLGATRSTSHTNSRAVRPAARPAGDDRCRA
jgi:hypothetical protein